MCVISDFNISFLSLNSSLLQHAACDPLDSSWAHLCFINTHRANLAWTQRLLCFLFVFLSFDEPHSSFFPCQAWRQCQQETREEESVITVELSIKPGPLTSTCDTTHTFWEEKQDWKPRQSAKTCLKLSLATHGFFSKTTQNKLLFFDFAWACHQNSLTVGSNTERTRMDVSWSFLIFDEGKAPVTKDGANKEN